MEYPRILFIVIAIFSIVPLSQTKLYHGHREESCFKNVTHQLDPSSDHSVTNLPQKCITLNHPYCLGIKLPYRTMALPEYLPDLNLTSIEDVQAYLNGWQSVQSIVPECWPYLRVALCSNMMPQCFEDHSTGRSMRISKPSVDICNDLVIKSRCKFIERHHGWPALFNCTDGNLYMKNCSNGLRDFRHQESKLASCHYPLVPSSNNYTWFKDIRGCALTCKYPILDSEEQANLSAFIKLFALIASVSSMLALCLFYINKKISRTSWIARVIKRCAIFQLLTYFGWSLQSLFDTDIACTASGGKLEGLPLVANACVLSFLLTYIPDLSICFLIAYLGRLCNKKISGTNGIDNNALFNMNLLSFVIPLTLFVSVAFLGQIDGHGLYGICTVGQGSLYIRMIFIIMPKMISMLYGNLFFLLTIAKLCQIKCMKPTVRRNLIRMLLLIILSFMEVTLSIGNIIYEHLNGKGWIKAIDDYMACNLNLRGIYDGEQDFEIIGRHECSLQAKPLVILFYLELIPIFAKGLVITSWAFCESNYRGLRRKIIDGLEDDKDQKRRVKAYLDLAGSAFLETGNNMSIQVPDDTQHDLIDISSLKSHSQDGHQNRCSATPSSLCSTSININNFFPMRRRQSKRRASYKRSRDVVNNQRLIQNMVSFYSLVQMLERQNPGLVNGYTNNPLVQTLERQNPGVVGEYMNFLKNLALEEPQPNEDYPFMYGTCHQIEAN